MSYPQFYDDVKSIVLYDPLSEVLGSFEEGIIKIKYIQIVKAAGHSCPTVAGAYLMCLKALEFLYGNDLPVRGEVKVEFKEKMEEGVAGVISNVISNITGATELSGFKGLNGQFARHSLMQFGREIHSNARFTRTDNGKSVDVFYDPSSIQAKPQMNTIMPKVLMNTATDDEKKEFGVLWQERVKKILIDNFDNTDLIRIEEV